MHKNSKSFKPKVRPAARGYNYLIKENLSFLEQYYSQEPNVRLEQLIQKMQYHQQIFDKFQPLDDSEAIWGDAHYGNCLYQDHVVTIIDTDFCGVGYKIFDIASYLWSFLLNKKKNYPAIKDEFLETYQSNLSLSKDELRAIPVMILIRNLDTLVFQLQYFKEYFGSYARGKSFWTDWLQSVEN